MFVFGGILHDALHTVYMKWTECIFLTDSRFRQLSFSLGTHLTKCVNQELTHCSSKHFPMFGLLLPSATRRTAVFPQPRSGVRLMKCSCWAGRMGVAGRGSSGVALLKSSESRCTWFLKLFWKCFFGSL